MELSVLVRRLFPAVLVAVLGISVCAATTILESQELPELVEQSERAVLASVVSVDYRYDDQRLPSTFVTLLVEEPIYGDDLPEAGGKLTLKLFGSPEPMEDGRHGFVSGTPRYLPGERYLLLLLGESRWGFTNTAGLPFGAFRIDEARDGSPVARSLAGNRLALGAGGLGSWLPEGLARSASLPSDPADPVPYLLLRQAVAGLWTSQGGRLRVVQ